MKKFEIEIKTASNEVSTATIILELLEQPNSKLTLKLTDGQTFSTIAKDGFLALRKIRLETEKSGIKLLIQGCRPNCWSSGMGAQMSNGTKIYVRDLDLNKNGCRQLVNTFDPAEEEEIGTLEEQDAFNTKWKDRLGL